MVRVRNLTCCAAFVIHGVVHRGPKCSSRILTGSAGLLPSSSRVGKPSAGACDASGVVDFWVFGVGLRCSRCRSRFSVRAFGARSKFGAELRKYLVFFFFFFFWLRLGLTPGSPLRSVLICKLPSSFAGLDVVLGRTAQVPGGVWSSVLNFAASLKIASGSCVVFSRVEVRCRTSHFLVSWLHLDLTAGWWRARVYRSLVPIPQLSRFGFAWIWFSVGVGLGWVEFGAASTQLSGYSFAWFWLLVCVAFGGLLVWCRTSPVPRFAVSLGSDPRLRRFGVPVCVSRLRQPAPLHGSV